MDKKYRLTNMKNDMNKKIKFIKDKVIWVFDKLTNSKLWFNFVFFNLIELFFAEELWDIIPYYQVYFYFMKEMLLKMDNIMDKYEKMQIFL